MATENGNPAPPPTAGTDQGMLDRLTVRRHPPDPRRWRKRWRWLAFGRHDEPHPGRIGLYEPVSTERDEVGVCCSGGGIRSAAFNLGALQELQKDGTLQGAKYLSAVSGGSYIAAAFCMVAKTWRTDGPRTDDSDPGLVTDAAPPFQPGSPEEQYLRNHLSYLAPDAMARVYLALRMLAGMTVNTLFIGLPVFVLGLLAGWLARTHYGHMTLCTDCAYGVRIPPAVVAVVLVLAGLAAALALLDVTWRARHVATRLFVATWEVRFFLLAIAAATVLVLVPWLTAQALNAGHARLPGAGAAVASLASLFAAAIGHVRGVATDAKRVAGEASKSLGRFAKPVRDALIAFVVTLAGPVLLLALAVFGAAVAIVTLPAGEGLTAGFVAWVVGSLVLLAAMWFAIDLMTVSLHPFYRRRLAEAFALKRVWVRHDGRLGEAPEMPPAAAGKGEPLPGAAEARKRDYDTLMKLSASGVEPGACGIKSWPMLIVCAAANVSDPGATPPGRAVASFTFSPRAIGGPLSGVAETCMFENTFGRNRVRDVTLLAAVAMSGAALAPAMGKLSYRPLKFLLAMTNIRLGVWLPNPARVGAHLDEAERERERLQPANLWFSSNSPNDRLSIMHRPRLHYLWKEVLGRNRLEDPFLYVTDGGHYENLGLVELLRRGCRTIYCFDAGGGTGSLGDAIALARTELNVRIDMEPDEAAGLAEDPATGLSARSCARGTIHFPAALGAPAAEGTLFYVRNVLPAGAPWALHTFRTADPVFPHHSTFDQFFTDQKFEAYRCLGAYAAASALTLERLHAPAAPDVLEPAGAQ